MKTLSRIFVLILSIILPHTLHAEFIDPDAVEVLDRVAERMQSMPSVVRFEMTVHDAQAETDDTQSGVLSLSGDKFRLQVADLDTRFDGTTQAVYSPVNHEVTLSTPTPDDLAEINPLLLFRSYKSGYKIKREDDLRYDQKPAHEIKLYPEDRHAPFFMIRIVTDAREHVPLFVELSATSGVKTAIRIKRLTFLSFLPADTFLCTPSAFPDAEVIDLR